MDHSRLKFYKFSKKFFFKKQIRLIFFQSNFIHFISKPNSYNYTKFNFSTTRNTLNPFFLKNKKIFSQKQKIINIINF